LSPAIRLIYGRNSGASAEFGCHRSAAETSKPHLYIPARGYKIEIGYFLGINGLRVAMNIPAGDALGNCVKVKTHY
jgi:hypothetical protein